MTIHVDQKFGAGCQMRYVPGVTGVVEELTNQSEGVMYWKPYNTKPLWCPAALGWEGTRSNRRCVSGDGRKTERVRFTTQTPLLATGMCIL